MSKIKNLIREYREHWLLLVIAVVAIIGFSSLVVLSFTNSEDVVEYKEMVSSLEEQGYGFVTELYRIPSEEVLVKFCDTESQIFLYKNDTFNYSEIKQVEEVYFKKDFFCKF